MSPVPNSNLISHTEGRGSFTKMKYDVAKDKLLGGDITCTERCDWLTDTLLSANERRARCQVDRGRK